MAAVPSLEISPESLSFQESSSIGAQIHRVLRHAIIRGTLKPGESITEVEMAKRFEVSRQPVREAFIKLSEERLVEVRSQRGTYVRKISPKEVLDARHLREVIEVAIVREVADRKDAVLITKLRSLLSEQRKVAPGDSLGFLTLDDEFHRTLALSVEREYAWRITEVIKAQMNRVRFLAFDHVSPKSQLVHEHTEVVDAIAAGDADLAARRMEKHLRALVTSLPLIVERHPEHFLVE